MSLLKEAIECGDRFVLPLFQNPVAGVLEHDDLYIGGRQRYLSA